MHQKSIEQVKGEYELEWMKLPGVEGVGITLKGNKKVIVVYISEKTEKVLDKIPQEVEGYKVICEQTSGFQAF